MGKFIYLFILVILIGCQSHSPPIEEMVFASTALKAAEKSDSEKYSPDYFRRAEANFWRAKTYFSQKRYKLSAKHAYYARRFAERAELDSELKRTQGGGNAFSF